MTTSGVGFHLTRFWGGDGWNTYMSVFSVHNNTVSRLLLEVFHNFPHRILFGPPLSSRWWIVTVTSFLWSQRRSLWMLCLPVRFVCDRFRLWVLLWFVLIHWPLLSFRVYKSRGLLVFFVWQKQKSSRTNLLSVIRDYPTRDSGLRYQDHELITKITKPLREVSVILFMNRSPDTRLQLVTRDHDLITTSWSTTQKWTSLVIQFMIRSWTRGQTNLIT